MDVGWTSHFGRPKDIRVGRSRERTLVRPMNIQRTYTLDIHSCSSGASRISYGRKRGSRDAVIYYFFKQLHVQLFST